MTTPDTQPNPDNQPNRRALLVGAGAAAAGIAGIQVARKALGESADVFVARGQSYAGQLAQTIRDGLIACQVNPEQFRGKHVLLKPNLVEPSREIPHMTTHPAVIIAAAEVFRGWGASVAVGEGPGHVRDTEMALYESGVGEALRDGDLDFIDLNYQAVAPQRNLGRYSKLRDIHLPQGVWEADYVVSLPKMKTHHWVGLTCSMKNLYGVLPGIKYGWPKNVLHHHGIPETVVDVNCALPRTLAIVDGIDCMEGDGPILGTLKHMGLLLVGRCLPAVDATAARIMGMDPLRVSYLTLGASRLGPIEEMLIRQRGEPWRDVASPFYIIDEVHLQRLRARGARYS